MKGRYFIPIALLSAILLLSFASAAQTAAATVLLNTPANSAVIGGTSVTLNSTINSSLVGGSTVNITWYAKSATSANSTWVLIATNFSTNLSITSNDTIKTFSSSILEDANDYIFNVTYINGTGSGTVFANAVTTASITVDNGIPVAPSITTANHLVVTTAGTQTVSSTVTDANTTSCSYFIARGSVNPSNDGYITGAGTYATSTCTFVTPNFVDSGKNGGWQYYIRASDGTNTTDSALQTIDVQIAGVGGGAGNTQATTGNTQATTTTSTSSGSFFSNFLAAIKNFWHTITSIFRR